MSSRRLATALSLLGLLSPLVLGDNPISPTFNYGSEKVRGVNLGGWLVLEVCPLGYTASRRAVIVLILFLIAMDYAQPVR